MRSIFFILLASYCLAASGQNQDIIKFVHYNLLYFGATSNNCNGSNNSLDAKKQELAVIMSYLKPDILTVNELGPGNFLFNEILSGALNIEGEDRYQAANPKVNSNLGNMLFYNGNKMGLLKQEEIRKELLADGTFVDQSMEEIKFQISQKIDTQTTYSFGNLLQNTNLSFIIFSLFQKYGLGRAQASDLHNCLLNNHVGAEFYTKNYLLIVGRNYTIFLSKLEEKPARQYLLYEGGQILFGRIKISISKKQKRPKTLKQRGSNTLYVNSRINFPLIVRHWEHGDRIQPLGMHGTKLLSDVFIDNKMDFFEKSNLPILICQSEIVCAGKYQLSEKFSVQPKDDSCFAINFADE